MYALTVADFEAWLRGYKKAWEGRDAEAAAALFTPDAEYYWTPFDPPQRGRAAIYVNQIEDERLDAVMEGNAYLEATQSVLQKHGGLWFNDETFVVVNRRP